MKKVFKDILADYQQIEDDLTIGGECIIELDKSRAKAIEEKNKFLEKLELSKKNLLNDI